jgi:hypothetical protein
MSMAQISRDSLWTLEHYARIRNQFRQEVIAHKRIRQVALGEHITLFFEDEKTIRYQIQEMLRIEKTFEESGIQDELDAYNPLIPDGRNFKCTMMIEYPNPEVRKTELAKLKGLRIGSGFRSRAARKSLRSPTRTSSEKMKKRHLRCISCDSNSTRIWPAH